MYKGKIEAMVTKFSEKFAIIMPKKHRKFCRCCLTHLDATPTFQKSFRSLWFTLYRPHFGACILLFGLFGQLRQKVDLSDSEQLLRVFFSTFCGQKKIKNI
jgi:hypothetical protein